MQVSIPEEDTVPDLTLFLKIVGHLLFLLLSATMYPTQ